MRRKFDEMSKQDIDDLNGCGRYLLAHVLRQANSPDFTMGGISSKRDTLLVPHPEGPHTLQSVGDDERAIMDVLHPVFPGCPPRFKPRSVREWSMSGGNWLYSCDSRFGQMYGGPVAIHDRVEG